MDYSYHKLRYIITNKYALMPSSISDEQFDVCIKNIKKLYPNQNIPKILFEILLEKSSFVKVGTSGYVFDWWFSTNYSKSFYPIELPKKRALQYYTSSHVVQAHSGLAGRQFKLNTVELNTTFYRLPTPKAVAEWYKNTPADFTFIVKLSKFATHNKKLIDFKSNLKEFWVKRSDLLKEKCGGIIIQMPPSFKNTNTKSKIDGLTPLERVEYAGESIKNLDMPQIFIEFRDESWFSDNVTKVLRKIGWSMVFVVTGSKQIIQQTTSLKIYPTLDIKNITVNDTVYFRFHGPSSIPYIEAYSEAFLTKIKHWVDSFDIKRQYYIFNNTDSIVHGLPTAIINAYQILA